MTEQEKALLRIVPRGKFAPPHREFEPVLPAAVEGLTRLATLPKVLAVSAPPGYGKTVLLSLLKERQQARGHTTAWLTLDDRDHSVESVASLALLSVSAALGDTTATPRDADGAFAAGSDTAEHALLSALGELSAPLVLIIDNVHFCVDGRVAAFLDRLTFETPAAVRLVVSSTRALPMDLVRAKLELGAKLVTAESLCMDASAIVRLFETGGQPLDNPQLAERIVARTEGWPAAVRLLLVLSQQPGACLEQAIEQFSGEHSDIASVLTRRVLSGFEPALVHFLCEIALLREFCAELSAEVTGEPQAAEWIDVLLQRNLLVFPLDSGKRWLRMHTLLRQFLLAEGKAHIDRERRRAVLERAARWHEAHGDEATAIDLALEAPSYAVASSCLERSSKMLVGQLGQLPRFIGWVEQLQTAGAPLSLDTHAWYIWALCFSLKYEAAQRSIEAFDARLSMQALPVDEANAFAKRLGLLRVVVSVYLDNLEHARSEAAKWLSSASDQDALGVATVATAAAIGDIAAHDFVAARWHIEKAAGAIERSDSAYGRAWVASVSACVELWQGDPAEADRLLVQARPRVVEALGADAGVVATMDFVHARALVDLGRLVDAQAAARRGLARATQHGVAETSRQGLAACLGFWDGEPSGPWSPGELGPVVRSLGPRVGQIFDALLVRRLLQLGRMEEATHVSGRLQAPREKGRRHAGLEVEASELALARIDHALASGRHQEALGWIDTRLSLAQSHGMRREVVELHLMAAGAHILHGDDRPSLRHLSLAIVNAARRRLVGPFRDKLHLIRRILAVHPDKVFGFALPDEKALLARLRQWCEDTVEATPAEPHPQARPLRDALPVAAQQAPMQPLTPREVQFLELLAAGLNNQQIADRTSLSVPTVKWHLYNLYGKLSVKNRTAALAAARAQGVLQR